MHLIKFNFAGLQVALSSRLHTGKESPDSIEQRTPITSGLPPRRDETVPQKITTLFKERVKMWGKSPRPAVVTLQEGKPCVLKCHV